MAETGAIYIQLGVSGLLDQSHTFGDIRFTSLLDTGQSRLAACFYLFADICSYLALGRGTQ